MVGGQDYVKVKVGFPPELCELMYMKYMKGDPSMSRTMLWYTFWLSSSNTPNTGTLIALDHGYVRSSIRTPWCGRVHGFGGGFPKFQNPNFTKTNWNFTVPPPSAWGLGWSSPGRGQDGPKVVVETPGTPAASRPSGPTACCDGPAPWISMTGLGPGSGPGTLAPRPGSKW